VRTEDILLDLRLSISPTTFGLSADEKRLLKYAFTISRNFFHESDLLPLKEWQKYFAEELSESQAAEEEGRRIVADPNATEDQKIRAWLNVYLEGSDLLYDAVCCYYRGSKDELRFAKDCFANSGCTYDGFLAAALIKYELRQRDKNPDVELARIGAHFSYALINGKWSADPNDLPKSEAMSVIGRSVEYRFD